jgi:predicted RNA-binding protein YlqC (UPF0109 family)
MLIATAADPRDVPVHQLLQRILCVIVDHPGEVAILAEAETDGTTFIIIAHPSDVRQVIGSQGRTAKSLRTILGGIGKQMGRRFTVVINDRDSRGATEK